MKKYPYYYKYKKSFVLLLAVLFIISCSSEKHENAETSNNLTIRVDSASTIKNQEKINAVQSDSINFSKLDILIRNDMRKLSKKYPWIPYYGKIDHKPFYITSSHKIEYETPLYTGYIKYGLVDSTLLQVLDAAYDKISNPDLVLKDCFEISIGSKVGLYNYRTHEILKPQFDYILPSQNEVSGIAYGFKNDAFYAIKNSELNNLVQQKTDPVPILKSLRFNILKIQQSMMFNSYYIYYEDDVNEGNGVVIIPSYLSYFKFFNKEGYKDIILPEQKDLVVFGLEQANLKTSFLQNIKSKIMTFLVTVYEVGIEARDYANTTQNIMVYNKSKGTINSLKLWDEEYVEVPCSNNNYKFIGDSLLEVMDTEIGYSYKDNLYDFEPRYRYYTLESGGQISFLKSNRHFPYTKYVFMDETYFYGCFAKYFDNTESNYQDGNMWQTDHLSLEDLDLMRNEIFAEYGLIFKTEKWKDYFSSKSWYAPKYDDVNDKLSPIDRANLKVILERQNLLKKDEQKYTQKRAITYYAAG